MSVTVVPYSATWPELFMQEAVRLQHALAPWLVGPVEHVGSTAIAGLAAKPILDMLGPVATLDGARNAIPALADLGYRHADHRPREALWFYKQAGEDCGTRTHQMHLTRAGSALWRERLAFRDALRAEPRLVAEYQELKLGLAAQDSALPDYTDGKRAFVRMVLKGAGVDLR